jgi:hypothetical protein
MNEKQPPRSDKRTQSDAAIVAALMGGATRAEAAKAGNVSASTVQRRLREPEFKRMLRQADSEVVKAAAHQLAGHASKAVSTLAELLDDPEPKVRLQAADKLLLHLVRVREHGEMADRLHEVERELERAIAAATGVPL